MVGEIILYGLENFVADFGGYLGLLLGGSIPLMFSSLIDFALVVLKRRSSRNTPK